MGCLDYEGGSLRNVLWYGKTRIGVRWQIEKEGIPGEYNGDN